jgi:ribonucleotide reductase beta subunit family protein with ferritin-like domain
MELKAFNSFSRTNSMEPLFDPSSVTLGGRYTLFPISPSEQDLYKMYKKAVATFWTVEEIDFNKDKEDWEKLTENEQYFIKHILAFFAGSDGVVQENLATRFQKEVQSPVARLFYGLQNAMEGIHSETYSLLIDQYVKDKDEQIKYFRAIDEIPAIRKKAQWAISWIESPTDYATRVVGFACVEGIFFSGSFCAIYWLKKRGLLPGLTFSNELISRDEGLHTEFAVAMYHKLQYKLDVSEIITIVTSAVACETDFICQALPCSLIGMNARDMSQYIQFVADRLVVQLGYPKIYRTANPFDFMDLISLEGKTNFFEKKVSEYSKPGVGMSAHDMEIRCDEEF